MVLQSGAVHHSGPDSSLDFASPLADYPPAEGRVVVAAFGFRIILSG